MQPCSGGGFPRIHPSTSLMKTTSSQRLLVSTPNQVNDPIYEGIVALVFIHFGIYDGDTTKSKPHGGEDELGDRKRRRFAQLMKRTGLRKLTQRDKSPHATFTQVLTDGRTASRTTALSVETLVAVTELCLQGVFSETILFDILALFALGDVDNNFAVVPSDIELLRAFLHEGLLPRSAAIRKRFKTADSVQDTMAMLEAMEKLREASKANISTNRSSSSSRSEDAEWITLERLPGFAVRGWSGRSHEQPNTFLPFTGELQSRKSRDGPTSRVARHVNMLDILNGDQTAATAVMR